MHEKKQEENPIKAKSWMLSSVCERKGKNHENIWEQILMQITIWIYMQKCFSDARQEEIIFFLFEWLLKPVELKKSLSREMIIV